MSSLEEKGDATKKKTWKSNETPPRSRSRNKEKSVDVMNKKDPTPPRSRSAPNKERPPTSNGRNSPSMLMAKMSPSDLEKQLQELLTTCRFEEAATWLKTSPYLSEKFQLADVVRLVIDQRQYDLAGRLIRDHKLADNQHLVTFFVMELVRSNRFHLAVRYAQELIPHFNSEETSNLTSHPMWTPVTLIKAMIRAQQYKTALKYTIQFHLEREFPIKNFVLGFIHDKAWVDAFTVILDNKLDGEFPLDTLIDNLLKELQWSAAIKCIKMGKRHNVYTDKVLVLNMIECGDFLAALHHLKEFNLASDLDIVRRMLDGMLLFGEFYKAIKYAIKFNMTNEASYEPARLIERAIDSKQYHVAMLYIKKLKLEAHFHEDILHIAHERDDMLKKFQAFVARKRQRQYSPEYQSKLRHCLGDAYDPPEMTEVVVSVEEEVVKPPTRPSFLERFRMLEPSTSASNPLNSLNMSLDGLSGLGGQSSFADIDRAFADAFTFVPPPPTTPPPPPPLPPQRLPMHQQPPPPLPQYYAQPPPPLPLTMNTPPLPRGPPPPPTAYYGFQPPLPTSVASLAMQFHVHQPPPPPPPQLPPQVTKPHRLFVPSLSLKPSHIQQKF